MRRLTALLLVSVLGACVDSRVEQRTLVEESSPSVPEFRHSMPTDSAYYMPASIGSGVALFDYDADGDLDVYAINGGVADSSASDPINRLFRQDPQGFVDVTEASGLGDRGFGMGVAVGDYDNNGLPDVYVTNAGRDALYRNLGDTFLDVTAEAGLDTLPAWGASSIFLDFDADGWLDLFVVNYLAFDRSVRCATPSGAPEYCGPMAYPAAADRLYRNIEGTFTDVTHAAGIGTRSGKGLGVVATDVDGDGLADIYVANDGEPNFLWINRGDGTFAESAVPAGVAVNGAGTAEAGMGVAAGDVDGDLADDLFVTHLAGESNTLYRNHGSGLFVDETTARGLHATSIPYTGFGTAMVDLDNDGDLDIVVANGRINRDPPVEGAPPGFFREYAEPNLVYLNDGAGSFQGASAGFPALAREPGMSRGLAIGDLDNDGRVDLAIMETGRGLRVFRNRLAAGHWLGVRVTDSALGGRDVIGAFVTAWRGTHASTRQVSPGTGFLSSSDPRVHFGLGDGASVDSLFVLWPGGAGEIFPETPADRWITLSRGTGSSR